MTGACLQVSVSATSREEADRITRTAVERRLAACGQVSGPVRSTYHWEGRIEQSDEWLCLLKTTGARFTELERLIKTLHSHRNPEIVATPIAQASDDYLDWLRAETAS